MLFSRKDLVKIIIPLIAQQFLGVAVGLIDSMMVSSAGEAAVSGVSLINTLDILLIYAFSSLATGGAVVVSQFLGKRDHELARASAKQLIYVTTGFATLITVIVLLFRFPLIDLLFGTAEADVLSNAHSYFFYVALSFPLLAINDSIFALFRAMGNTMVSMKASLLINIANVIGNAILIYGFGMGAAGAAISTLFSRLVGSVLMIILIHNKKNVIYVEKLYKYRPDFAVIKRVLRIGIPNGIENSMFQFGKLLTQSLISSFGTGMIAANAVAHTLATFQYMPGSAIGMAAVTVVGRCIGAEEKEQARKYSKILLAVNYAALGAIVILTLIFGKFIIGLYGLGDESAAMAFKLIAYHGITAAVIWPVAFMLPNVLRAASDVKFTLVVAVVSMWIFRVALSYFVALETVSVFGWFTLPGLGLGVLGVWIAMTLDWLFRAILFGGRVLGSRWLTKYSALERKT